MATEADAEIIAAIFDSAFSGNSPLPSELITQQLNSGRVRYLIDEENRAVLSYSSVLDEAEIDYLAVERNAQGQGIGRQLLTYFLADQLGVRVLLEVAEGNVIARHLYEKVGFHAYHKRENYYRDGQTAILMEKKQ